MKHTRTVSAFLLLLAWSASVFSAAAQQSAQSLDEEALARILASVVVVTPLRTSTLPVGQHGSGTIISADGLVLTNFHVVSDRAGNVYRRSRIAVSAGFRSNPEVRYLAEYVAGGRDIDLALLRIVEDNQGRSIPPGHRFTFLPIGDSDTLNPNDEVSIWGYPGIGGASITSTRGVISGFVDEDGDRAGDRWIKTDAQLAPGNSGGAAVDARGRLVGVPTQTAYWSNGELVVALNFLRPEALARDLISEATGTRTAVLSPDRTVNPSPTIVSDPRTLTLRLLQGGTVRIAAGTYVLDEPLTLSKSVELLGEGLDRTFIVSEVEGYVLRFEGGGSFSVDQITFEHRGEAWADVVRVVDATVDIRNARFRGAVWDESINRGGDGLWLLGSTRGSIRDSVFDNNGLNGINVADEAQPMLENNEVRRNAAAGIAYFGKAAGTATGNVIETNGRQGIFIGGESRPSLRENSLQGNRGYALLITETARPTVDLSSNTFLGVVEGLEYASVVLSRILLGSQPPIEGEDVREVQRRLVELEYLDVERIDSRYGAHTETAVRNFQVINDLEIDGVVGPQVWEHLFSARARRNDVVGSGPAGTTLFTIVSEGTVGNLVAALKRGWHVNVVDEFGQTPLIYAVNRVSPNMEVIEALIDAGANVNARTYAGWTPLMYAIARNGAIDTALLLLDSGADPSHRNAEGQLAVDLLWDNPLLVRLLNRGAANPDSVDGPSGVDPDDLRSGFTVSVASRMKLQATSCSPVAMALANGQALCFDNDFLSFDQFRLLWDLSAEWPGHFVPKSAGWTRYDTGNVSREYELEGEAYRVWFLAGSFILVEL